MDIDAIHPSQIIPNYEDLTEINYNTLHYNAYKKNYKNNIIPITHKKLLIKIWKIILKFINLYCENPIENNRIINKFVPQNILDDFNTMNEANKIIFNYNEVNELMTFNVTILNDNNETLKTYTNIVLPRFYSIVKELFKMFSSLICSCFIAYFKIDIDGKTEYGIVEFEQYIIRSIHDTLLIHKDKNVKYILNELCDYNVYFEEVVKNVFDYS